MQLLHQPLPIDAMRTLHAPILETRLYHWPDEAATQAFAAALAARPPLHDATLELCGPLGAGKTSFVRHLLRALGITGRIKSPTYAVVEPYRIGELAISHFDFYRFHDPSEWEDAGFRELFAAPGLKISEWPEHAGPNLPTPDLSLAIELIEGRGETERRVRADAHSARGQGLMP